MKNIKGQSTVEYVLLVTAVVGVIILFTTGNNNLFQKRLNSVLNETTNSMIGMSHRLAQ